MGGGKCSTIVTVRPRTRYSTRTWSRISGGPAPRRTSGLARDRHLGRRCTQYLTSIAVGNLLDALALASAAEVTPNRWFLSGADFFTLRKLKSTDGKYLIVSDVTAGATYSPFGIPVTVTNKLPTGTAVLANMAEVAVVRDVAPSIAVLAERYAESDQQAIRVVTRYDLGLLHPEGVVVLRTLS